MKKAYEKQYVAHLGIKDKKIPLPVLQVYRNQINRDLHNTSSGTSLMNPDGGGYRENSPSPSNHNKSSQANMQSPIRMKMNALLNDEKFQKTLRIYAKRSTTKRMMQKQTSNPSINESIHEEEESSYGMTTLTPPYQ
jgi:hypothetical protein